MKRSGPVYLAIYNSLKTEIESENLKNQEKLPSEKELSEKYGVSRITLKKALSMLVEDEYICQIPGRGTFVTFGNKYSLDNIVRNKASALRVAILVPSVTLSLFPGIVRGAEDACRENRTQLILGNYDVDPEKERQYMEQFLEDGVDGLIVSPSYNSSENKFYKTLRESGVPFVFTDVPVKGVETDLVAADNFSGAYKATMSLLDSGFANIACIFGDIAVYSSKLRFAGYRQALEDKGVIVEKKMYESGGYSLESSISAGVKLLKNKSIEAIFCTNELLIPGLTQAAEGTGRIDIPISIFDEPSETMIDRLNIRTAVKQPMTEIGYSAASLLIDRIKERRNKNEKNGRQYKKVLIEPEIIQYK